MMRQLYLAMLGIVTVPIAVTSTLGAPDAASFKVICMSGTVHVQTPSGTWQPLKSGATFTNASRIRIGSASYLAAVDPSGYPFECSKPGDTSFTPTRRPKQHSSALVKITSYLHDRATQEQRGVITTGSATRSADGMISDVFPTSTKVLQDTVRLTWRSNQPVRLIFLDFTKKRLKSFDVADGTFLVDMNTMQGERTKGCLYWMLASTSDTSVHTPEMCILRATSQEREEIQEKLQRLQEEGMDPMDRSAGPLVSALLGAEYEQHGFKIDALHWYTKACQQAPDVREFVVLRSNLLTNQ